MNPVFAVVFVLACASALPFSNVKQMRIEVELSKDPSVRYPQSTNDSNTENDSDPNLSGRIINGSKAKRGQFPWQVYIYMDNSWMCGGSIITNNWILTAGHCAATFTNFVIYMGKTDRSKYQDGEQTRTTRTKIVNSNYDRASITNDIALLKMSLVTFTSYISAVQLPRKSDAWKTFAGQNALISGFGDTAYNVGTNILKYAQVNVISNPDCRRYYADLPSTNICTVGAKKKGTCHGDSGGPLVYLEGTRYTEIGIVSFGAVECIGAPSAYTRVTSFLDWISQNTGITLRN